MNNAILYGRVSTDKQTTEAQQVRNRAYCNSKSPPLEVVAEFFDDDISGSVPMWQRPEGLALRRRIEQGGTRHLIVAMLNRIGRNAEDILGTLRFLNQHDVVLHILDCGGDSLSTQGPFGRFVLHLLAGVAELDRDLIQANVQNKLDVKRLKGEVIGSVPYGWDGVETGAMTPKGVAIRKLVDNEEEQKWLRFMAHMRYTCGWSFYAIANHLNAAGVAPKHGRGSVMKLRRREGQEGESRFVSGKWQCGNVKNVLENKTAKAWLQSIPSDSQKAA